jgi:transposase-like protein
MLRYDVHDRDLEAIIEERSIKDDHATLNCWIISYSFSLALTAKK